jgi:hypothetical protein
MDYIDAIINYFKAWEYFLLRPETHWESSLERKHSMAVKELQRHVKQMLESIAITRSSNASKRGLFIDQLREIHKHHNPDSLVQSALEMMIAGLQILIWYSQWKALRNDWRFIRRSLDERNR